MMYSFNTIPEAIEDIKNGKMKSRRLVDCPQRAGSASRLCRF